MSLQYFNTCHTVTQVDTGEGNMSVLILSMLQVEEEKKKLVLNIGN